MGAPSRGVGSFEQFGKRRVVPTVGACIRGTWTEGSLALGSPNEHVGTEHGPECDGQLRTPRGPAVVAGLDRPRASDADAATTALEAWGWEVHEGEVAQLPPTFMADFFRYRRPVRWFCDHSEHLRIAQVLALCSTNGACRVLRSCAAPRHRSPGAVHGHQRREVGCQRARRNHARAGGTRGTAGLGTQGWRARPRELIGRWGHH